MSILARQLSYTSWAGNTSKNINANTNTNTNTNIIPSASSSQQESPNDTTANMDSSTPTLTTSANNTFIPQSKFYNTNTLNLSTSFHSHGGIPVPDETRNSKRSGMISANGLGQHHYTSNLPRFESGSFERIGSFVEYPYSRNDLSRSHSIKEPQAHAELLKRQHSAYNDKKKDLYIPLSASSEFMRYNSELGIMDGGSSAANGYVTPHLSSFPAVSTPRCPSPPEPARKRMKQPSLLGMAEIALEISADTVVGPDHFFSRGSARENYREVDMKMWDDAENALFSGDLNTMGRLDSRRTGTLENLASNLDDGSGVVRRMLSSSSGYQPRTKLAAGTAQSMDVPIQADEKLLSYSNKYLQNSSLSVAALDTKPVNGGTLNHSASFRAYSADQQQELAKSSQHLQASQGARKSSLFSSLFNTKSKPSSRFAQDFEELGVLGSGDKALVIMAKHRIDGCIYAIKKTRKSFHAFAERNIALCEVHALSAIPCHPNIVRYHTSWLEDSNTMLFIQLEYCVGNISLSSAHTVKTSAQIYEAMLSVARALAHIHAHQLAHLDIKPENILVTPAGNMVVADFGLCCKYDGSDYTGKEGDCRYLAPELLDETEVFENPESADMRNADLFAFGATFIELVTQHPLSAHGPEWHDLRDGDSTKWIDVLTTAKEGEQGTKIPIDRDVASMLAQCLGPANNRPAASSMVRFLEQLQ
mmetsp:Transcript_12378/g.21150  ORF Transcript_12378/g.21150 Transcript_12378/m.21150 type:complete len:703 (+) Transcript_12378:268-2376(+)|eukprot:CAMPEP_0184695816 /NCGR_PEP_ID=MMETSP0313-20130426/3326_1 /TAXON_ID=2792 /ORGANISM="Porphyridium aerugineum, Strain SAG 1380-2" /LENGTH=702 /DNA_ID=CAMNT_0027154341 /DNA_START=250 /DNA_END=2358 /DNA_ORIENTATION=+